MAYMITYRSTNRPKKHRVCCLGCDDGIVRERKTSCVDRALMRPSQCPFVVY